MKKIFFKFVSLTLAIASIIVPFVSAYKKSLPDGHFRVFKVAVVGSDIINGKPVDQISGFNGSVVNSLCSVGTKLENFSEIKVSGDNEVAIDGKMLPRTSVLVERNVYCFYDIANIYDSSMIKECAFAVCPYEVDVTESYDEWKERATRLRDFIKNINEMCDIKFLGVIKDGDAEGGHSKNIGEYIVGTQKIACDSLDIYTYQQTVNTSWIFASNVLKNCKKIISEFALWDREREFEECIHKSFSRIIRNVGDEPKFFQPGEEFFNYESSVIPAEVVTTIEEGITEKTWFEKNILIANLIAAVAVPSSIYAICKNVINKK